MESDNKTSVVLVTGSMMGGGAERVLSDMANYLARKGWRVTLATWASDEVEDFYRIENGVSRVWIDSQSRSRSNVGLIRSNFIRARKFRRLLMEVKPLTVLSFIDTSNIRTIVATMGLDVRVVVSERTNPGYSYGIPRAWRILRKRLYRYADAVTAQTADAARWIERECNTPVQVIANPLRRLPDIIGNRENLILAVGRLSKEKGFDLLIKAFADARENFKDWRVVIVGSGPDKVALESLCSQLGVEEFVEFLGPSSNIESWMARAGLVVQPSRFEGFPNVVLEAMGMGAAVISADCHSGPGEIIRDGINGRLIPVEDVSSLANVMVELMSRPEERIRLGHEAKNVRRQFAQERIMSKWEECLLMTDAETSAETT